jgi:hypothetical protein
MIVDWLNDALIFRAENPEERHSLAVMLQGFANHRKLEESQPSIEPSESKVLSAV